MEHKPLSVINSTLSAEHLAVWVSEKYSFTDVSCRLLKTNMNDSYLVTANNGEFVLRVDSHKHRNLQQVTEEVNLLTAIHHEVAA